ncbi:neuroblast differentiation-associated AHNAK-like, partial [Schistosoma japonicum]
GLDAHIDGKASKGGKKFHWSPKFGLPKGGLKIGGGAGVGKPDASVSVSGPTGGVDVSLPKPEVDVSLEVPDVDVSVPKIGVSGGVGKGGELGVSGKVSAPDVDVSVPSKKFTFGWGSKGKKAKKVKLPKVSGDVDAGLDVSGKIDVPSVEVDVDGGARGKGKKFHWSPHISLPKLKMHGPDLSAEIHADTPDVNVSGTVPDVDSCLSSEFLHMYMSDSFVPSTSSSFLTSSPEFVVSHISPPVVSSCLNPVVEEPLVSPVLSSDFLISNTISSRILPRNAFQDIDESFSSPVDSGFNGDISNDETISAEIDEILIVPIQSNRVLPSEIYHISSQDFSSLEVIDKSFSPTENLDASHFTKSNKIKLHSPFHILQSRKHEKKSTYLVNDSNTHDQVHKNISRHDIDGSHLETLDSSGPISDDRKSKKKVKSRHKRSRMFDGRTLTNEVISDIPSDQKYCKDIQNAVEISFSDRNDDRTSTPRRSPSKLKDPSIRKTWHGAREPYSDLMESLNSEQDEYALTEDISSIYQQPRLTERHLNDSSLDASDFLRRSIGNSAKRRPWSTLEFPPPGCHFVDDDYLFPDALTPTKIPSFRASKEIVYDVPYMDDKAIPTYEPEWPIGESRRTLISQLSQNSLIRMTAEEESSLISLDTKLIDQQNGSKRKNRFTSHFLKSKKSSSEHDDVRESRSKSLTRLKTWWSKHGSLNK